MSADAIVRMGYSDADLAEGLKRSQRRLTSFSSSIGNSFTSLGSQLKTAFGVGLGAIGVAAGAAGIKEIANEFDRLNDLAKQLDTTPEAIQRLAAIAKLSGTDIESVANALNRVNREIANGKGFDAFKELNLDVRTYLRLEADDQIIALADAFQNAESRGQGLSQAYDLIGRSAAELLPLLRTGGDELRAIANIEVISAEQVQALAEFNDLWDKTVINVKTGIAGITANTLRGAALVKAYYQAIGAWLEGRNYDDALDRLISEAGMVEGDAAAKRRSDEGARVARKEAAGRAAENKKAAQSADEEENFLRQISQIHLTITRSREKQSELAERDRRAAADAAESAKRRSADLNRAQGFSLLELQLLEAQARHQNTKASRLERELRMQEYKLRYMRELNATEQQAEEMAKRRIEAEDRIAGRRTRIKGYSREQDPAAKRGAFRHEWDKLQQGNFWDRNQRTPGLDKAFGPRPGAGAQQQQDQQKQAAAQGNDMASGIRESTAYLRDIVTLLK